MDKDEARVRRKAQEDINNGIEAEAVLNNLAFQRAFTEIKGDNYKLFIETDANDSEKLKLLAVKSQVIQEFEDKLTEAINTGAYGRHNLSMLDRAKKVIGL